MKCCYMVTRSLPPGSVNAHLSNYTGQSKCGWQHIVIINVLHYAACQTQWLFTESFQHNPHILNWQIYSNLINDTGIIGIIQPIISIIIFVPALFGLSIWGYFAWCLHLSPQSPSIDRTMKPLLLLLLHITLEFSTNTYKSWNIMDGGKMAFGFALVDLLKWTRTSLFFLFIR